MSTIIIIGLVFIIGMLSGSALTAKILTTKTKEDKKITTLTADKAQEQATISLSVQKEQIINQLFKQIEICAKEGKYRWFAHSYSIVAKDIEENFTREELTAILEPKGYKVSFMPLGSKAEILFISWEKNN